MRKIQKEINEIHQFLIYIIGNHKPKSSYQIKEFMDYYNAHPSEYPKYVEILLSIHPTWSFTVNRNTIDTFLRNDSFARDLMYRNRFIPKLIIKLNQNKLKRRGKRPLKTGMGYGKLEAQRQKESNRREIGIAILLNKSRRDFPTYTKWIDYLRQNDIVSRGTNDYTGNRAFWNNSKKQQVRGHLVVSEKYRRDIEIDGLSYVSGQPVSVAPVKTTREIIPCPSCILKIKPMIRDSDSDLERINNLRRFYSRPIGKLATTSILTIKKTYSENDSYLTMRKKYENTEETRRHLTPFHAVTIIPKPLIQIMKPLTLNKVIAENKKIDDKCGLCHGKGVITRHEAIEIKPEWVDTNEYTGMCQFHWLHNSKGNSFGSSDGCESTAGPLQRALLRFKETNEDFFGMRGYQTWEEYYPIGITLFNKLLISWNKKEYALKTIVLPHELYKYTDIFRWFERDLDYNWVFSKKLPFKKDTIEYYRWGLC